MKIGKFLVWFFGWNISSVKSSKKLHALEIIVRVVDSETGKPVHDGIISSRASLAHRLKRDNCLENKEVVDVTTDHYRLEREEITPITDLINSSLCSQR